MSNVFVPIASETFFVTASYISFFVIMVAVVLFVVFLVMDYSKMMIVSGTLGGLGIIALLTFVTVWNVNVNNFVEWAETEHGVWDAEHVTEVEGFMEGDTPVYSKALNKVIYVVNEDGGLVLYSKDVAEGDGVKLPSAK